MEMDGSATKFVVEHLKARYDRLTLSPGLTGPSIRSIQEIFARREISRISLSTAEKVMTALDWSLTADGLDLSDDIFNRLLSPSVEGSALSAYIEQVLIPLLSKLRKWGTQHQKNVNQHLQKIVTMWIEKVLPVGLPPAALKPIALSPQWDCKCSHCSSTRAFLVGRDRDQMIIPGIAKSDRKHIMGFLSQFAKGLVKWEGVRDGKPPHSLKACCFIELLNSRLTLILVR